MTKRELEAKLAEVTAERDRYRVTLAEIANRYGRHCDDFATCTHVACNDSVGAWLLAKEALEAPRSVPGRPNSGNVTRQ